MSVREAFVKHAPALVPLRMPALPSGNVSAASTPRILVADDEAGIRDVVRRYLEAEGYDVAFARDGAEALALARRTNRTWWCST